MTLYLLKVHLQTFLSIPITQKCQILSCDTVVANEQYVSYSLLRDHEVNACGGCHVRAHVFIVRNTDFNKMYWAVQLCLTSEVVTFTFICRPKVTQFTYCNTLIQNLGFHWKSEVTVETAVFMTKMYLRIHSIIFM